MQRKYGRQEAKKGSKQMTQNVGRGGALAEWGFKRAFERKTGGEGGVWIKL